MSHRKRRAGQVIEVQEWLPMVVEPPDWLDPFAGAGFGLLYVLAVALLAVIQVGAVPEGIGTALALGLPLGAVSFSAYARVVRWVLDAARLLRVRRHANGVSKELRGSRWVAIEEVPPGWGRTPSPIGPAPVELDVEAVLEGEGYTLRRGPLFNARPPIFLGGLAGLAVGPLAWMAGFFFTESLPLVAFLSLAPVTMLLTLLTLFVATLVVGTVIGVSDWLWQGLAPRRRIRLTATRLEVDGTAIPYEHLLVTQRYERGPDVVGLYATDLRDDSVQRIGVGTQRAIHWLDGRIEQLIAEALSTGRLAVEAADQLEQLRGGVKQARKEAERER